MRGKKNNVLIQRTWKMSSTYLQKVYLCALVFLISPVVIASKSPRTSRTTTTKTLHRGIIQYDKIVDEVDPFRNSPLHLDRIRGGCSDDFLSPTEETDTTIDNKDDVTTDANNNDNDEDRYSRQIYTLGARAHKLVRSTTILLDGPTASGLTYECAKNLALSGVGSIIIMKDDSTSSEEEMKIDGKYHNEMYDDLGKAYQNNAQNEISMSASGKQQIEKILESDDKEHISEFLFLEYLRRLNPSLKVSVLNRSDLIKSEDVEILVGDNPVFICIDRPETAQIKLNNMCRGVTKSNRVIPFISVESRGVYARVFCDYGDDFHVHDEDGETPKSTLVDRVIRSEASGASASGDSVLELYCIDGEKHDVSRGDIIQFKFDHDDANDIVEGSETRSSTYEFNVLQVKSPTRFTISLKSSQEEEYVDTNAIAESENSFLDKVKNSAYAITFSRVKVPQHIPFISMQKALNSISEGNENNLFAASDLDKSFDMTRRSATMASFAALGEFVKAHGHLPNKKSKTDLSAFEEISSSISNGDSCSTEQWKNIVRSFAKCAAATLAPVQSLIGSIGAQEALKAASGLYNPIRQFLLYDCDELLQHHLEKDVDASEENRKLTSSISPGQSYILGSEATGAIANSRIFVVGSGAIGCEILKNLSAMGAATKIGGTKKSKKKRGCVLLTDMDTIERSNLSRQLLFRDTDVGKFKSFAAKEAIERFNPKINMDVHSSKVGDDVQDSGPFNDSFWSKKIDVILNALDNVEARLFMDRKCVEYRKGLVDSGTLGPKGNMQVVVPMQSESYGSSVDPPEPAIPVCTLKNFPYEISHTIQWGRDLFDGLFNRRPTQANGYHSSLFSGDIEGETTGHDRLDSLSRNLLNKFGEDGAVAAAEELGEDLGRSFLLPLKETNGNLGEEYRMKIKKASIQWAVNLSNKLFHDSIVALLRQHPEDSVDEDGDPFWTGTRRLPKILSFDPSVDDDSSNTKQVAVNKYLSEFVQAASRLRMEMYFYQSSNEVDESYPIISLDDAIEALTSNTGESTSSNNSSVEKKENKMTDAQVLEDIKKKLLHDISSSPEEDPFSFMEGSTTHDLCVAEFEKDDDTNGHVDFVTSASNLRALIYSIPPTTQMETRRIAGQIVPAMITTTAFVSALSCIELMKLLLKFPLHLHRNAFVNLALPFFAFTQPLPADEVEGLQGETYTLWDRITIKEKKKHLALEDEQSDEKRRGMTLRELLKSLQKKIGKNAEVSSVSYGPYMIYANFLHLDDDSVLDEPLWDLVKDALISGDDMDDDFMSDFDDDEEEEGDKKIDDKVLTDEQLESIQNLSILPHLDFSVVVEDGESGDEVEIPPVRVVKYKG